MPDHIANRRKIISALKEELVGPSPQGTEIDCNVEIKFAEAASSYGPWKQYGTGEEILHRDAPTKRYGVGVLYPLETIAEDEPEAAGDETSGEVAIDNSEQEITNLQVEEQRTENIEKIASRTDRRGGERETDDFDLTTANLYKPSSMAVSFLAEFPEGSELIVKASGGRYRNKKVQIADKDRDWWLRSGVGISARFSGASIRSANKTVVPPVEQPSGDNTEGLDINIEVFARPYDAANKCLLTVCLINRKKTPASANLHSLFQSYFEATVITPSGEACILPYPGPPAENLDPEEKSLALLYRDTETFAVGHGCAANWEEFEKSGKASWVSAECLPEVEIPSITSDITRKDGSIIAVSMAALAGLIPGDDGFSALSEVIELYDSWIEEKRSEITSLDPEHQEAALNHMSECASCAQRMKDGLDYLKTNEIARRAFQLANHAILLQQVRSRREPRRVQFNTKTKLLDFTPVYSDPDPLNPPSNRGKWRAFQIAFLLMSVRSAGESESADRKTVELIWFPTGGGKTEAYLGLAAYATFMRRFQNPNDNGVHTLMRYTLRLLTAQQFQRAAGLLCAMEYLRRRENEKSEPGELGSESLSIGIWLGGTTTPNTRADATFTLKALNRGDRYTENLFVLNRCPWCGAQMGTIKYDGKKPAGAPRVLGYEESLDTVVFKCPDSYCEFTNGIPVYVIDEDIYEKCPSLIIGTVDKFAMLAWRPQARSIFGFDNDGERIVSPPGLIIQDELHLISGPLGSMVGLYETVIEELCTDRRGDNPVPPKIVSSTATIRRYKEQIKALYAREQVTLFPPPGLDANESFFAKNARDSEGKLKPGRIYVGVHAPGLGSLQTAQVRTFSALLQAPVPLPGEERDPWWTLLLFFNSLRELGTTLSLFQSDIPDYFKVLLNRTGLTPAGLRNFWNIKELTGRLRSDEVPEAISALEVTCTAQAEDPVDVCLASNIIEVGVDIDRLSVMAVIGQPKTTSQYIQVTGRVGRQWFERPGLVVTIYGASKPRDRSHFEKFRTYHERLYAQVEPTSVTPFSPPVLDRALHAVMSVYARQNGDSELASSPYPYPGELIETLREILLPRVEMVDQDEVANFKRVFDKKAKQWENWERTRWSNAWDGNDISLLREPGAYVSSDKAKVSWPTPQSMRNVDAECQVEITQLYINQEDENA
jgi:hypothetical protein